MLFLLGGGVYIDVPLGKKVLDWNTRMKIAVGAAKGLEYLHNKMRPAVIYRDLKCSNILLGEGYWPKLSDFGLAKVGPSGDNTHVSTRVMGTYGYCAPDYAMTGQLTFKCDIYSFGVVLLELITGRKAIDYTRPSKELSLVAWVSPFIVIILFTNVGSKLELIRNSVINYFSNIVAFWSGYCHTGYLQIPIFVQTLTNFFSSADSFKTFLES